MLPLTITMPDEFDEQKMEFIPGASKTILMEHSLISLQRWESKWHKSLLKCLEDGSMTDVEMLDYFKCMTVTQNVDTMWYNYITNDNVIEINAYITNSMTATVVYDLSEDTHGKKGETLTAELIYYYMTKFNIPFECEKWHLNTLMTLLRVCIVKETAPNKKMGKREALERQRKLNEQRLKEFEGEE